MFHNSVHMVIKGFQPVEDHRLQSPCSSVTAGRSPGSMPSSFSCPLSSLGIFFGCVFDFSCLKKLPCQSWLIPKSLCVLQIRWWFQVPAHVSISSLFSPTHLPLCNSKATLQLVANNAVVMLAVPSVVVCPVHTVATPSAWCQASL